MARVSETQDARFIEPQWKEKQRERKEREREKKKKLCEVAGLVAQARQDFKLPLTNINALNLYRFHILQQPSQVPKHTLHYL